MTTKRKRKWVKLAGSDVRLEYRMKQPPKKVPLPPILFEQNEDGEFTQWFPGLFGPVGHKGTLFPGQEVIPLKTKRDFAEAERLEKALNDSRQSQTAFVFGMSGGRMNPDKLGQSQRRSKATEK